MSQGPCATARELDLEPLVYSAKDQLAYASNRPDSWDLHHSPPFTWLRDTALPRPRPPNAGVPLARLTGSAHYITQLNEAFHSRQARGTADKRAGFEVRRHYRDWLSLFWLVVKWFSSDAPFCWLALRAASSNSRMRL